MNDWQYEKRLIMQEQKESLALADDQAGKTDAVLPAVGEVWQRRDGSRFTIEKVGNGYAIYWLASGSKPQYRTISFENFKRYRRVR